MAEVLSAAQYEDLLERLVADLARASGRSEGLVRLSVFGSAEPRRVA